MLALSTTWWWVVGYAIGGAVVLVAASLLLVIIALARRIAGQAVTITGILDATRANTEPLFDVAAFNHTMQKVTREIHQSRGELGPQDRRTLLQKLRGKVPGAA